MIRGYVRTLVMALGLAAVTAAPAFAGTIALTGHDDDLHCFFGDNNACNQLKSLLAFVRGGSSLPVLVFDHNAGDGLELDGDLTNFGIAHTTVDPTVGVTDAMFDPTLYSAFVVASDVNCGGCDMTVPGENNLAAHTTAIDNFFNAGGGILGLTSSTDTSTYYQFVPQVATSSPIGDSSGFVATGAGCTTAGFAAVNGDQTHNTFSAPGTPGTSGLYCVAERFDPTGVGSGPAVTLLLSGGTIVTDVITSTAGTATPEPATLALLGIGMCGAAVRRRFRSKK